MSTAHLVLLVWVFAGVLACPAAQAAGETPTTQNSTPTLDKFNMGDALWHMAAAVVIIAAMGVGGYVLIKKVLPRYGLAVGGGRGKNVRLLETLTLGQNKQVHLLRVDGQKFLVASSKDRVSLLARIEPAMDETLEEGTVA